ncbi:outer membrane beta-barrel protein [Chitinimonas arctica]|uniref:Outer membrane beta-barrel protein n=1 Tax=Chitinimonas arctica TaxID=2594795 RepID=A0A516SDM7_9NEIS|nr:outer membrane beta-barrel protein [Chitinimonas arctica]QDQ26138.1 outer membrane beta-barrel protein [Chitinimonas arctica]
MQKQFAVFAIAAALAAPAFAEGFYAGGDIGRSKVEVKGDGISAHKNDNTWSAYGGYQFHPNFAAEVGYRSFGKIDATEGASRASVKARGLEASLVGSLPVTNELSVFGRVGVTNVKATYELRTPGGYENASEKKTKGMFGIGARYAVSKEVGLTAEYRQVAKMDKAKLSTFTVGGDYRF